MRKVIRATGQVVAFVNRVTYTMALVSAWTFFGLMLLVVLQVLARYVLRSPLAWPFETSGYLLLIGVFLALAFTQREHKNVNVDLLVTRLTETPKAALNAICYVAALVFSVVLLWQSSRATWQAFFRGSRSQDLGVPLYLTTVFIPLGSFVLCLALLLQISSVVVFLLKNRVRSANSSEEQEK